MKAIETRWKGWRFRSRTEARWAVFLEAAGIGFEYEPEGVLLPSGPYLPDFRLTEFPRASWQAGAKHQDVWLEVKAGWPTDLERARCCELATASGCPVLLAMGVPDFSEQVLIYEPEVAEDMRELFSSWAGILAFTNIGAPGDEAICVGRGPMSPQELQQLRAMLDAAGLSEADELRARLKEFSGGFARVLGMEGGRVPPGQARIGLGYGLRHAYDAARSARFEFGQTDKRWEP